MIVESHKVRPTYWLYSKPTCLICQAGNFMELEQIQSSRNENIGRLFLRAHRDFQVRSAKKLAAHGYGDLNLAHLTVISHLDTQGTRIVTLAERASMTKQSMGQLVQELEEKGYVEREPDPTDRRAALIKFTDSGMRFLADIQPLKQEIEAEYTALLGADGLETLRKLLTLIVDHASEDGRIT